jgi:hypothetical protein
MLSSHAANLTRATPHQHESLARAVPRIGNRIAFGGIRSFHLLPKRQRRVTDGY